MDPTKRMKFSGSPCLLVTLWVLKISWFTPRGIDTILSDSIFKNSNACFFMKLESVIITSERYIFLQKCLEKKSDPLFGVHEGSIWKEKSCTVVTILFDLRPGNGTKLGSKYISKLPDKDSNIFCAAFIAGRVKENLLTNAFISDISPR